MGKKMFAQVKVCRRARLASLALVLSNSESRTQVLLTDATLGLVSVSP